MTKRMILCAAIGLAIPVTLPASEFPLKFKTLNAQEAMAFPGGYGAYGMIGTAKPPSLKKEPAAVSKHPLYGELRSVDETNRFLVRLDESKGNGKGYDQLIVDWNQNGDLADDAVTKALVATAKPKKEDHGPQTVRFGPMEVSAEHRIGNWHPIYFAEIYLYNPPSATATKAENEDDFAGQLRLKPGWYLETTVEMDGVRQRIGIVDGDANLRLGERSNPQTYSTGKNEQSWYFQGGDDWLQDTNSSGRFQASPFGPILYLGAKPYKARLGAGCKSVVLEPWSEPLAELVFGPHGDQIRTVTLALENPAGEWHLIQPTAVNGRAKVPPGNYRLYTATLSTKLEGTDLLTVNGSQRIVTNATKVAVGAPVTFRCGAPLTIQVTSERDTRRNFEMIQGPGGTNATKVVRSEEPLKQLIEASVIGVGGELYSGFGVESKKGRREPPAPIFTITAADGKQVATGKMEFG